MKARDRSVLLVGVLLIASLAIFGCQVKTMAEKSSTAASVPLGHRLAADDPNPPSSTVKLIFVHHSTGGNWLADPAGNELGGGLGRALMNNNYYVSATNYGWEVEGDIIGDRTDIGNWWEWFRGPTSATILDALYNETGQNFGDYGSWPRLATDPGGENTIILFKSCFPNSALKGSPSDPVPPIDSNPLRGQDAYSEYHTVANAKGIYMDLLQYFATRQDKLFIVITAPPLIDGTWASNARAFNNWLLNDWLDAYPYSNVAVFDFYNVLTSNGGDPNTNDLGWEQGNHHRWWNGAVQHLQTVANDTAAYPTGDDHPSRAGNEKATGEFVRLLNVFYNRWAGAAGTPTPSPTGSVPTSTPSTPPPTDAGNAFLPIVRKHVATPPPSATPSTPGPTATPSPTASAGDLVQPSDLVYRGAFRLPDDAGRPRTFEYGGNAMTFNGSGDPSGPADGFPGSLFAMGHDRLAYGELPDGNQVAELSIPVPVISSNLEDLNYAEFLQGFHDVAAGFFTGLDEIPRVGMCYLDTPATGPLIHLAWGQHMPLEPDVASHAWFSTNLAAPNMQGTWFIGDQNSGSVTGYMFVIPSAWADAHAAGRYLATGRYRDGGWSGMGPALFAYRPWVDESGTPAAPGTHLDETVLLLYESSYNTESIEHCLNNYQHTDEWEGGAWITTGTGKTAVLFAGTKGTGAKYWYGYANPAGPEYPCVEEEMVGQFTLCRLADGTPCPAEDLIECAGHSDYRGWWGSRWDAQILLYDPADLAQVAAGSMESWDPQPYAVLDIDDHLFRNPDGVEEDMLGTGVQRRFLIGDVAYDREHGLLYVLELYADGAKPVVHVWAIN